jgi:hypothetical protein
MSAFFLRKKFADELSVLFIGQHSSTTQEHGPDEILTAGGVGDKELQMEH